MSANHSNPLEEEILSPNVFRAVARISFAVIFAFVAGHFLVIFLAKDLPQPVMMHLNLDYEGNLSTWVNSLMLLAASLAAFLLSWIIKKQDGPRGAHRRESVGWMLVGIVLFYLATDDAAQIHDTIAGTLAFRLRGLVPESLEHLLWYSWIPIFFVLGVLTLLILSPLIRRTMRLSRRSVHWIVAGLICFIANAPIEVLENIRVDLLPEGVGDLGVRALMDFNPRAWYELQGLIMLEESLEMIGATCFLLGFLLLGRKILEAQSERPCPDR